MKTKTLTIMSALLIAPVFAQAEWIHTANWPYIYRHATDTWEYAYTPCFWTCSMSSGEYTLWGEGSAVAPDSIQLKTLTYVDTSYEYEWIFGQTSSTYFHSWSRGNLIIPVVSSYCVRGPDRALIMIQTDDSRIQGTTLIELRFTSPEGGFLTESRFSDEGGMCYILNTEFRLKPLPVKLD